MDFELSEDESALAQATRKLCESRFSRPSLRAREGEREVIDRGKWKELAGAGVFDLRAPEENASQDDGPLPAMPAAAVVFEELGRALVPGPLVATHLFATDAKHVLAAAAASGAAIVGSIPGSSATGASPVLVGHLGSLDALLVIGPQEVRMLDAKTLAATAIGRSIDPLTPLWQVTELAAGERVDGLDAESWRQQEQVLTSGLLVGIAAATLDMAVSYALHREQFGRPIGSFQAMKHICADMLVRVETARAAVHAAACNIDHELVGDVERACASAALTSLDAATANAKACIQVHGGMGFTWEVPAHLYLMRARVLSMSLDTVGALAESVASRT